VADLDFLCIFCLATTAFYLKYLVEENKRAWQGKRPIKNTFWKGSFFMRAWRSKLIFLLIVYFAGFATAIYCLAPVPDEQSCRFSEKSFAYSALKSDEFAKSFNTGMYKCLDFGKEAVQRLSTFLKQKLDDRHQTDG
jgi:hypothetical protein